MSYPNLGFDIKKKQFVLPNYTCNKEYTLQKIKYLKCFIKFVLHNTCNKIHFKNLISNNFILI